MEWGQRSRLALRAWLRLGGWLAVAREERMRAKLRAGRLQALLFTHGASAEERIEARAWAAQAVLPRNRVGHLRPPARMDLSNRMLAVGLASDGRGRWAVRRVIRWRGTSVSREGLVEWEGFSDVTGEPWPNEWVHRRFLSADLRRDGNIRGPRTTRPREETQDPTRRVGMRVSPRLAGEVAGQGL